MDTTRQANDRISFRNEYGSAELRLVTDFVPVRSIRGQDIAPEHKFRGVETAEQLALITENRGIQIAFDYPLTADKSGYVVVHDTTETCAVAHIESLEYAGPEPRAEIRRHAQCEPRAL